MKWLVNLNYLVLFFHALLFLSIITLCDYLLFSLAIQLYNIYLLILFFAFICGIGILMSMNSILNIVKKIKYMVHSSNTTQLLFIELLLVIVAGILISIPGIISSSLGWILYAKPIRILISHTLYKAKIAKIIHLHSYFLAENIK